LAFFILKVERDPLGSAPASQGGFKRDKELPEGKTPLSVL